MKRISLSSISLIVAVLIMAAALAIVFFGVADYAQGYGQRSVKEIRAAVRSYVAQCYALEGRYPPDLDYLEENYGLLLDSSKYVYHYELFASNIFPDVQVFAINKAGE